MRYKFEFRDYATDEEGTLATHSSIIESDNEDIVLGAYYTSKADLTQNYDNCEQKGKYEWLFANDEEELHSRATIKLEKYEN